MSFPTGTAADTGAVETGTAGTAGTAGPVEADTAGFAEAVEADTAGIADHHGFGTGDTNHPEEKQHTNIQYAAFMDQQNRTIIETCPCSLCPHPGQK